MSSNKKEKCEESDKITERMSHIVWLKALEIS